jgi:transmembrane sensor
MQMNEDNERIAEEAANWFIANQGEERISDEEQRRFTQWLESSPRHAEEYLEIAQLAGDLPMTAAVAGVPIDALMERARAANDSDGGAQVLALAGRPRREKVAVLHQHAWLPFAAAAALVLVALGPWWSSGLRPDAQVKEFRFASAHGELPPPQTLEDGSVLQLNTDTSVVVRYSAAERRIDIERGQAVFTVRHETARPFRVIAGDASVLDIGTKFDVYLQPDATVVTVLEGRVEVSSQRASGKLSLVAGQQVRVSAGVLPAAAVQVDAERETAYLRGLIIVENKSIAEVADEFNRHVAVPIQIITPRLQQKRIDGTFPIGDVESFLDYLRLEEGARVETTPTRIAVSGN